MTWDADTYEQVASPQESWAREIIARAGLEPGERVLDAGCGGGRVTTLLLEQGADVIAVDGDAGMVAKARETLPDTVPVLHQDLLDLELDAPVDVVFSCAVFHWITDPGGLRPPTAGRWRSRLTPRVHATHPSAMLAAAPCDPGGRPAPWAGLRGAEPPYVRLNIDAVA